MLSVWIKAVFTPSQSDVMPATSVADNYDPDPALVQLQQQSLEATYTIFNRIRLLQDPSGTLWFPELWAKDLCLHLVYLSDLRLCCPVESGMPRAGFVSSATHPELAELKVVPMRPDDGWFSVIANFVPNFLAVARGLNESDVIHSGAAGWPFPPSYYLLAMRRFKQRKWVFLVESTVWHLTEQEKHTLRRMIVSLVSRFLVRRCVASADVRIFTSAGYRDFLLPPGKEGYVNNATWIDREHCTSLNEALTRWDAALGGSRHARFLFPARLTPQKGVLVLLEAIRLLSQRGVELSIDIMGSGALEDLCRRFTEQEQGTVRLRFIEPVPYGPGFFETLAQYDAVLVPSLSDEQPRVPFDAFSQGVPVIGSNTIGIREVVKDGVTGFLCPPGDAHALAAVLERYANAPERLRNVGLNGLEWVRGRTHAAMHLERAKILNEALRT